MRDKILIVIITIVSGFVLTAQFDSFSTPLIADESIAEDEFSERRRQLVEALKARGIQDSLTIHALNTVRRHRFVPADKQAEAYEDYPLPIGFDQTISQPYIVAYMTQQLQLNGDERVLEIGTGSGYQAAVLAELAREIFTIEIIDSLSIKAQKVLSQEGYENIHFKIGDGYDGWPEAAPFDCIIVTAAPKKIPQPLVEQLAVNGRMVIPVGGFWQELVLISKAADSTIVKEDLLPVRFVPMTGKSKQLN